MGTVLARKIAGLLTALSASALTSGCTSDFWRPSVEANPGVRARQSLSQQGRTQERAFFDTSRGGGRSGY